ncbi:hypothetical protein [Marinomonas sp. 2405UD68-3]|uniref:hypothetical protein n=1 Tax=Marinomonas sp. 2405UD68-3 TaxID=3391835 RepID=UPI0039C95E77
MKYAIAAALMLNTFSANAAGTLSTLLNYDHIFSKPSTATSNTDSIISGSMEYSFPRSLAFYGGASFFLRDSFESTIHVGARFYSMNPIANVGNVPVWSFIGLGNYFVTENAYYPEVGFRVGINQQSRVDITLKVLNSSDTAYDNHAALGFGFSF